MSNYANDAEGQIYLEDANVLASHKPYITFIVGTAFTPISTLGRDFLQGAYVAQHEHNMLNQFPLPGNAQVRLLIANFGDKPACAAIVANQLVKAVQADPTIKGLIGWPSVARSADAVKVLTDAHFPVIEPVDSSDSLTSFSPYFFRVAPTNKSEAIVGANFAKQTLHAKNVALFMDPNDPYSLSLGTDFKQQFQDATHNIVVTEIFAVGNTDAKKMSALLTNVLQSYPHPDLIYFAGTAQDVDPLLAELPTAGPDTSLKVLGGNGLYQLGSYNVQSGASFNRLYFTAATYPDEWRILGKTPVPVFFADYRQFFDPSHIYPGGAYGYERPSSNVILAYDSIQAFLLGSALVGKSSFTPADLQQALTHINGNQKFQGVSGQIAFGTNGDPINKVVLILMVDQFKRLAMLPIVPLGQF